jgi:hypothetical protein
MGSADHQASNSEVRGALTLSWRTARIKRIVASFNRHSVDTGRRGAARVRASCAPSIGKLVGASPGPAQQALSELVPNAHLTASDTVVILALPTVREPVTRWVTHFRGTRVFVIAPETLPEWHLESLGAHHRSDSHMTKLNWHLKLLGAVDVVIDLMARPISEQQATFFQLFWHLSQEACTSSIPARH